MIERRSWAVTLLLFTVTASACTQSEPPNAAPSTTSTAQMDIEDVSGIDDTPYQTQTDACRTNETRHFDDHTVASLVRQVHQFPNDVSFHERSTGGGIVLEDLDGDRDLDLVLTDGRGVNGIFFNDGQGTFLKGANRGVAYPGDFTVGLSAADYDNDGDTDLLILNRGPDRLLRNDGGGRFEDVYGGNLLQEVPSSSVS